MRWRAASVTIGPISAARFMPSSTCKVLVRSSSLGITLSATSPTSTATLMAMQRSPAEP